MSTATTERDKQECDENGHVYSYDNVYRIRVLKHDGNLIEIKLCLMHLTELHRHLSDTIKEATPI